MIGQPADRKLQTVRKLLRERLEEEFNIEIPDEDAEKITRVKEAVDYRRVKGVPNAGILVNPAIRSRPDSMLDH